MPLQGGPEHITEE